MKLVSLTDEVAKLGGVRTARTDTQNIVIDLDKYILCKDDEIMGGQAEWLNDRETWCTIVSVYPLANDNAIVRKAM